MRITRRKKEKSMENIGWRKKLLFGSVFLLATLVLAVVFAPFILVYYITRGPVLYQEKPTLDNPLQEIYKASDFLLEDKMIPIRTQDGFSLWASEIEVENPKAVVIYLTDNKQPSITYFYGHAKWMKDNGYASILLETRGHGESEGNVIGLGYTEVNDVRAVVEYIMKQERYLDVPIVLQGVSMGGAVAINAFGQIPEVDALIAMSAYTSVEDAIIESMRNHGVPEFLCKIERPLVKFALSIVYGRDAVETLKPIDQIKNANDRPVFFISSKEDMKVSIENINRFREANPEAEYWVRDSSEHLINDDSDFTNVEKDTEYCNRILDFLDKVRKAKKNVLSMTKNGSFFLASKYKKYLIL
ncbi:MAG TPA: lysophospholipase [Lachnoclostridium phytofermentans]|uniref:Lysophospholipase n=1 Tax=Lachnoclostridium phytofermentans TaxID=66219 RepID=A0A3D2XDC9_9FIRM|nr:alpha/beta fold hydrolase [Lachnoclostridium sp.]HCL04338.1 lysophospholipase [Lachnoclostridium phytofermentans]